MMNIMSTLIFSFLVTGFVYLALFNKPQHTTTEQLKNWFSRELADIAANLEQDIEKEIRGEYPHADRQTFNNRGMITYLLLDKNKMRFDISDKYALSSSDITSTEGYKTLIAKIRELNLSIILEEIHVDGDGVSSFNELDEYIYDYERYYTVTVSGW